MLIDSGSVQGTQNCEALTRNTGQTEKANKYLEVGDGVAGLITTDLRADDAQSLSEVDCPER